MGHRGKLAERQQAAGCGGPACPWARSPPAGASPRAACRCGCGTWSSTGRLSDREFLVAGIALYAGEGAKRDGAVKFANSDPRMIAFYCAWLRQFFEIDETRLRLRLYLHEGLDLGASIACWSESTGIPPSQFQKPYRATPDSSIRHTKHVHGCVSVDYSCSSTHRTIMGLVRGLLGDAVVPG